MKYKVASASVLSVLTLPLSEKFLYSSVPQLYKVARSSESAPAIYITLIEMETIEKHITRKIRFLKVGIDENIDMYKILLMFLQR